ncbi:DUF6612 family protein [Cohnella cholangitidis]|uniref:Lipoprotein n=1 Tax=Cohnella cholangitidis TaxID=2598458 RepID=A0A7G5BV57_9BACL|nr:DUF6612 family protein [Cohnella cholangitidis]QMV40841.1 hypothetical protein FPL14_06180 [Cohnella cholangitidis]
MAFVLTSCGERLVPEEIVRNAMEANEEIRNFSIGVDAIQEVDMGDLSMTQKVTAGGVVVDNPLRFLLDMEVKNQGATIDVSVYKSIDSYYIKDNETPKEWIEAQNLEQMNQLEKPLMDFDKPNVYLSMILEDDNHLTAEKKEDGIHVVLAEPSQETTRKITAYLLDTLLADDAGLELQKHELKKLDILINESSGLIENIVMEQHIVVEKPGNDFIMEINQTSNITYSDYNTSEISIPNELQALINVK